MAFPLEHVCNYIITIKLYHIMRFTQLHRFYLIPLLCLFSLFGVSDLTAQINYNYHIDRPYTDYSGPYYIKLQVNFIQSPGNQWINNWNVSEEADAAMATLNTAFNKHNIFFIPYENPNSCLTANYEVFTTGSNILEVRANIQDLDIASEAYNIYVTHDNISGVGGWVFNTPLINNR